MTAEWVDAVLACAREVAEAAQGPVYVAARRGGRKLWDEWGQGPWRHRLKTALTGAAARASSDPPDLFEICLTHSRRSVLTPRDVRWLSNARRGISGVEVELDGHVVRFAPTDMIARNLSFPRALHLAADGLAEAAGSVGGGEMPQRARLFLFDADQVLLWRGPPVLAVRLSRGKVPVAPRDVTRGAVEAAAGRMGDWLLANTSDDGRMVYKYWPSRGRESGTNNQIRQWMATICLGRWAARRGGEALREAAVINLRYNLAASYRREGRLGMIDCGGKVKLGAVALAALAVAESGQHLPGVEESLAATIDHLWREGGAFQTFLRPPGRNDCQNFYPGEALLYWSHRLARADDAALLSRFMATAANYQAWHRERPNPAFVPWHTQAYYNVWRRTRDPRLRDWVLAMNDWLLRMQQWETAPFEDMRGRFYDPLHPDYGPPHASSDGVYLEGLADACALARQASDGPRADAYRLAIVRGLRHVLQLQFSGEADLYYVSKRRRLLGALRTAVYDNTLRVDNVQHNLMAAMKVLELFGPEDFRLTV